MSHIPASAMPHAKPHDEPAGSPSPPAASDVASGSGPLTSGPEIKPAEPKGDAGRGRSAVPYAALAAVGALAVGGLIAALAWRRPEPPRKHGRGKDAKPKRRPRKVRDAA